ncbi:MAG: hypothetical protein V1720_20145 [bacterium]
MSVNFLCPSCRGDLNVAHHIVLTGKTPKGKRGLLFLSQKLGNYKVNTNSDFKLEEGELIQLFCPICHDTLLAADIGEHLARLIMVDEKGEEYQVVFSEIQGEHCTYKIKDDDVEPYGEDSQKYLNFFGEGPKY